MPRTNLFAPGAFVLTAVLTAAAPAWTAQPGEAALSPEQIVAVRQAAMGLSGETLSGVKAAADGGAEPKTLGYGAYTLFAWAKTVPGLFPPGTGPDEIKTRLRAKPQVWSDRAGFEAAAAEFTAATSKLRDLSKTNDAAGFKAQLGVIEARCNACHAQYRSGPA
jgi:cytochrome c556